MKPRSLLTDKWMFYLRTGKNEGKQLGEVHLPSFGEKIPAEVRRSLYEILFAHREIMLFGQFLEPQAITMKVEGFYPRTLRIYWKKKLDVRWKMKRTGDNVIAVVTRRAE